MGLPFVIAPENDELLYSWIHRLAKKNMLPISFFAKRYLNLTGYFSGELKYEITSELLYLKDEVSNDILYDDFYRNHSTMDYDFLFISNGKCKRELNRILYNPDFFNTITEYNIEHIYVCPECIKEDKAKFGFAYLHTKHHLSGVKMCHKHNVSLLEYSGPKGKECEFDLNDYKSVSIVLEDTMEDAFTKFAAELYDLHLGLSVDDVKSGINKRIAELDYSFKGKGFERFKDAFERSNWNSLLSHPLEYCRTNFFMKSSKNISSRVLIPILIFLFSTTSELIKYLPAPRNNIQSFICDECLNVYWGSIDTNIKICHKCMARKSTTEKIDILINSIEDGAYRRISDYESFRKRVILEHSCGNKNSFILANFLYGRSRCACESLAFAEGFLELQKYKDEHGNLFVPKKYENKDLANFCMRIRKAHKAGTLPEKYKSKLDDIGFVYDVTAEGWMKKYDRYVRYYLETGITFVERDTVFEDIKIGLWYSNLIRSFNAGRLTDEQVSLIKAINPDFPKRKVIAKEIKQPAYKQVRFDDAVALLLSYQSETGSITPAKRLKYRGYNLGAWCQQMRSKRRLGILPQAQIEALNKIGFIWDALSLKWTEDLARYDAYVKETGITEVPKKTVYEGFKLGYWYSNLKAGRRNGTFSDEQKKDIEKINPEFFKDYEGL